MYKRAQASSRARLPLLSARHAHPLAPAVQAVRDAGDRVLAEDVQLALLHQLGAAVEALGVERAGG